jgi:hypothetical protein
MSEIRRYPKVAIRITAMTVSSIPLFKKSWTDKYGRWKSSTISKELTLGKEEKGKPIAAETSFKQKKNSIQRRKKAAKRLFLLAKADPTTICSGIPKLIPIEVIIGIKIKEATV